MFLLSVRKSRPTQLKSPCLYLDLRREGTGKKRKWILIINQLRKLNGMQIPIVLLCFSDLDLPHSKTLLSLYGRHRLHAACSITGHESSAPLACLFCCADSILFCRCVKVMFTAQNNLFFPAMLKEGWDTSHTTVKGVRLNLLFLNFFY